MVLPRNGVESLHLDNEAPDVINMSCFNILKALFELIAHYGSSKNI